MEGMIGVCGTPGTGKKTVSPVAARLLGLPPPISINSLAPVGGGEVDAALLRRRLLRLDPPPGVLFGHLLPHVLKRSEAKFVAVLRCEPSVLRWRLAGRGYTRAKVIENVEAELIGVLLDECVKRFGTGIVREYDTTSSSPKSVAGEIARDARGRVPPRRMAGVTPKPQWIDWTLGYDSSTKLRSLLADGSQPPTSA